MLHVKITFWCIIFVVFHHPDRHACSPSCLSPVNRNPPIYYIVLSDWNPPSRSTSAMGDSFSAIQSAPLEENKKEENQEEENEKEK
uniref:Secreted protein n=1 Tax=Romanomermis culicivorax TaxID=13658 RepID=A0A915KUG3_ROMCU